MYGRQSVKGGRLWVLDRKKKGTWVQCTQCGKVDFIQETIPIDKVYFEFECQKCGHDKGLNCGSNIDYVYMYYDPSIDGRFYQY
jgi:hypothetical protein